MTIATATTTEPEPGDAPVATGANRHDAAEHGHIGRIVAGTLIGGLLVAITLVVGPFAGAREHVITGTVLLTFAAAWALLATLAERWTDQPQRWAFVPAAFMASTGTFVLVVAPTGNEAGWVWPPAVAALAVWMAIRARRDLRSRTRVWLVYPICAALFLSALGGAYETYRETADRTSYPMPGQLVDVGGHKLHISCVGNGSPTVVLEPGLGEPSTAMALIAPEVATTTRVCVYDRAGRGWSESAAAPQDGTQVATDLHTLLDRAGEHGPYVLAGHSAGGLYVMSFARLYPEQVAGVVLLDSMSPRQYDEVSDWPAFYEMFRRASAVLPSLFRFGVGRVVYGDAYDQLPTPARDAARAFLGSPRGARSTRDEFSQIRTSMAEAQALTTLGDRPLIVVTAEKDALGGWVDAQDALASLSTDSDHRLVAGADHDMLVQDKATATEQSSRAIRDVVDKVRGSAPAGATTAPASTPATRPTGLVDELVPVHGARLHLHCDGTGPTTVVLIAGFGGARDSWAAVEPTLSQRTRVCSYERFGDGTSDAPPAPQTFATEADDLHALLQSAGEPGPYVLVGHSFGGPEAVTFASRFAADVRGLLLVDASPTEWNTAICAVPDDGSETARVFVGLCAEQSSPDNNVEHLDAPNAFAEVATISSLGDVPMTILTADHSSYPGLAASHQARLNDVWTNGQAHWASLAPEAQLIPVDKTGHNIQLERPDVVLDAIDELLR
jgi:pimeloyl-ACP methyl ester carboxylesterase